MKIQIVKPSSICIADDGSQTERYGIGEQVEGKSEIMKARLSALVREGRAIEVGGNAEPTETKAKTTKRRVTKKAAD